MEKKKEKLLVIILAAIVLVWVFVGVFRWKYVYWPAIAGALTIPLLLAALFVDNLNFKEEKQ